MGRKRCHCEVIVAHRGGVHLRVAALIVRTAQGYASEISISSARTLASAKSIIGVLSLAAARHTPLTVEADGPDAEQAVAAVARAIAADTALGSDGGTHVPDAGMGYGP